MRCRNQRRPQIQRNTASSSPCPVWPGGSLCAFCGEWVASVHLQAIFEAVWTVCGRSPAVGKKYLRAITPSTIDGVPPLHQIVGNISTRRRITRKSVDCRERREETPARTEGQICATFRRLTRNERRSRIKNRRQARRPVRSLLPAVRTVTGVFGEFQGGVEIAEVIPLLRSSPPESLLSQEKSRGHAPKDMLS